MDSDCTDTLVFDCKQSGESGDPSPPLRALGHDKSHANAGGQLAVVYAFDWQKGNDKENPRPSTMNLVEEGTPTLGNTRVPAVACGVAAPIRSNVYNNSDPGMEAGMHIQQGMAVRRLTPRECERLQGFPDDWTRWAADGIELKDGPRYRMLGNAVAVPVAKWLGERIMLTERRSDK